VGRRYRSIAGAGAQQQRRRAAGAALTDKCGQCHVDSRRRRLNTDLSVTVFVKCEVKQESAFSTESEYAIEVKLRVPFSCKKM